MDKIKIGVDGYYLEYHWKEGGRKFQRELHLNKRSKDADLCLTVLIVLAAEEKINS